MKTDKEHVLDELSAYLDGEATDMGRVARHVQQCETCARRHMELLRLSNHLRHLPEPSVPVGFAARVTARAGETQLRVWPTMLRPVRLAALALAACLVAVAVVAFRDTGAPEVNTVAVAPPAVEEDLSLLDGPLAALEVADMDWLIALEGELGGPPLDDFDTFVDLAVLAPDEELFPEEDGEGYSFSEDMDAREQALFDEALGAYFDGMG